MTGRRHRAIEAAVLLLCVLGLAACAHTVPVVRVGALGARRGHRGLPFASARAAQAASSAVSADVSAPPLPHADLARLFGEPLHRSPYKTRKVALTLDDGPSVNTARVLRIFETAGVRCTFFYVGGRAPRYHEMVRQAAEAGFEIEDHTWDHQEVRGVGEQRVLWEIGKTQQELTDETGRVPRFFRPPAGHWDPSAMRAVTSSGLVMALWSLHGQDTGPGTHAGVIERNVVASARGGDIILLHERNPQTVLALPAILEGLKRKGLQPVTLEELLMPPDARGVGPGR